jgi:putative transposase
MEQNAVFAGQTVGLREEDDGIWLVSFLEYDLGFFDQDVGRVEPAPNPFIAKVLTMSPEQTVNHVPG